MRAIGTGFVAVAAIGLFLSGCGGSDDTTTATTLQQPTAFNVNLTGTEVVPGPGDLSGTATAQITVDPKGTQVCYTITLSGLSGINGGQINEGKAGVAGPAVVTIPPSTADAWEGCVDAKPAVIKNLSAGTRSYYVDLQSSAYPDGAVRAQLTG